MSYLRKVGDRPTPWIVKGPDVLDNDGRLVMSDEYMDGITTDIRPYISIDLDDLVSRINAGAEAEARAERAEKALEEAMEALRNLTGRAESFWALLQGDYGVKISSEDQEDHNVYEFFFAIERAKAAYLKEKEKK